VGAGIRWARTRGMPSRVRATASGNEGAINAEEKTTHTQRARPIRKAAGAEARCLSCPGRGIASCGLRVQKDGTDAVTAVVHTATNVVVVHGVRARR